MSETDTISSDSSSSDGNSTSSSSTDVGGSIVQYDDDNSSISSDKRLIIKRIWDEYTYNTSNNMMSIKTLQVLLYDFYYTYYIHLSHMTPDKPATIDKHKSIGNSDMNIFSNTVLSILNIGGDKKCISYIEFFDTINRFDIVYDK